MREQTRLLSPSATLGTTQSLSGELTHSEEHGEQRTTNAGHTLLTATGSTSTARSQTCKLLTSRLPTAAQHRNTENKQRVEPTSEMRLLTDSEVRDTFSATVPKLSHLEVQALKL